MPSGRPCPTLDCTLNVRLPDAEAAVCDAWDGVRFELAVILTKAPTDRCPFLEEEVLPIVRRVARKARLRGIPVEDLLGSLVLTVLKALDRGGEGGPSRVLPGKANELQRFVAQVQSDVAREDLGRLRCSGCLHYREHAERAGGSCGLASVRGEVHPYFGRELDAHTDPRSLPCMEFRDRRRAVALSPAIAVRVRREDQDVADVREALGLLVAEDPFVGNLVMGAKIDGRTYDDLARAHGSTRDRVRSKIEKGLARLREILESGRKAAHET